MQIARSSSGPSCPGSDVCGPVDSKSDARHILPTAGTQFDEDKNGEFKILLGRAAP